MGKDLKDVLCVVELDMVGYVYHAMEQDTMVDGNVGDVMDVDMTNVFSVMETARITATGAMEQDWKAAIAV